MRYPKGSIQLNESRDLPLLRQILRSEFVSHSQLLEFMRLNHHERTGFGFAKDYDAVVTVRTEAGEQRFALEYERSPKTIKYYKDVAASLSREVHVNHVLYLTCNYDLLQFISGFFGNTKCRVFFGLAKDWHSQLLDMPVSCSSATRYFRLRETLDDAAAYVDAAAISA